MQNERRIVWACLLSVFVMGCSSNGDDQPDASIDVADKFLDAFYQFDQASLTEHLEPGSDADRVLYYQAWAEAAHYKVKHRSACTRNEDGAIVCAITVTDDFGKTMGYEATDTFTMKVQIDKIVAVSFKGDDPPIFEELFAWIAANQPEVLEGPCKDLFNGGTTPAACSRAVVEAARTFIKLRDFS